MVESRPAAALDELTVTTDTPGFPAKIRASNSAGGGFVDVSEEQTVEGHDHVRPGHEGREYRYYLVWLHLPEGGVAHVNGVSAG